MPILRGKKKPALTPNPNAVADVRAALEACEAKIRQLERENETNIKRMGAMQAEIDHLRAKIGT